MLRELALGSHPHLPSKQPLAFTAPNNENTRLIRLVVTGRNLGKVVVEDATFNGKSLLLKKGVPAATFAAVQGNAWIAIADKKNPLVAGGIFEVKLTHQGDPLLDLNDATNVRVRIFTLGIDEAGADEPLPPVDDDASLM